MIFKVSSDIWQKATKLANEMKAKSIELGLSYKFLTDREQQARITGLAGEICFARIFGLPEVQAMTGKDKFDFDFNGMRIDLKTHKGKGDLLVNCAQFYRKKHGIDSFAFGRVFDNYFEPLGWISTQDVDRKGKVKCFANGSKAFVISLRHLHDFTEIPERVKNGVVAEKA